LGPPVGAYLRWVARNVVDQVELGLFHASDDGALVVQLGGWWNQAQTREKPGSSASKKLPELLPLSGTYG